MKFLDKEKLEYNILKAANYDLENNNLFGSSYFVYQNGNTIFKKHFGIENSDTGMKTNDDTMYRLASMTKPVTAVAILILLERGLISLNDSVSKFLPEFEDIHIITPDGTDMGKTKTDVTILHCLTHTSGFGSEKVVQMSDKDRRTFSDTIKYHVNAGLDFEPFTKQAYSGVAAFDVLGAIVEKVTNRDYEEFLKEEIFIPCNMKDTTFAPSESQWKRFMTMHDKADGKNSIGESFENCVFGQYPGGHKLAGAGLASTLNDYSNFAKMLLNNGKAFDRQIVSPQTISAMSLKYLPENLSFGEGCETWGLGVRVIANDNYKTLPAGSFGWSGAYGSHFWIDTENDICAVFMKNSRFDGGAANRSAQRFERAVYDALII